MYTSHGLKSLQGIFVILESNLIRRHNYNFAIRMRIGIRIIMIIVMMGVYN